MDTMYTRKFSEWVLSKEGEVVWDIYSTNITEEARDYLGTLDKDLIRFRDGINYFSLPSVLRRYDIGVILYNGHIPNYVYNAPNKLFEYWACGLDVWFPDSLKTSLSFVTKDSYPKVLAVDFNKLEQIQLPHLIDRDKLVFTPCPYYCEMALEQLFEKMKPLNEYAAINQEFRQKK